MSRAGGTTGAGRAIYMVNLSSSDCYCEWHDIVFIGRGEVPHHFWIASSGPGTFRDIVGY